MSISVSWPNGTVGSLPSVYSIPEQGDKNWYALSNFLEALANGAQSTTFQRMAIQKYTATPITVPVTGCVIVSAISPAGACVVNLPGGSRGAVYYVVDSLLNSTANHITVTPNGADTINGGATFVMSSNGASIGICYDLNNTNWVVFSYSIVP